MTKRKFTGYSPGIQLQFPCIRLFCKTPIYWAQNHHLSLPRINYSRSALFIKKAQKTIQLPNNRRFRFQKEFRW